MRTAFIERRYPKRKRGTLELLLASGAILLASGITLAVNVARTECTLAVCIASVFLLAMCGAAIRYGTAAFEYELNTDSVVVRRVGRRDRELFRAEYVSITAFFPMRDGAAKRHSADKTVDACASLYARLGRGIALYARVGDDKTVRLLFEPSASFCETLSENLRSS